MSAGRDSDGPTSERRLRREARAIIGAYHEEQLRALLEHVRTGFARLDAGEIDPFELDDLIHHYKADVRAEIRIRALPAAGVRSPEVRRSCTPRRRLLQSLDRPGADTAWNDAILLRQSLKMADDEILRRLDDHLAVANEHMGRGNELMAENRRALAEHHQAMEEIRVELSQMSLRGERVAREFVAELREHREELRQLRLEHREETLAWRRALFAILDQLKGGGGPAAAGA